MNTATVNIDKIIIDDHSIYLEDYGNGKGKIIITGYLHNYSTYWGAMGGSLKEFICRINEYYFADRLTINRDSFDAKASVRNVRKHIREELCYELPWYRHMEAQKELRAELKRLENCSSENDWVYLLPTIPDSLLCIGMDWNDEQDFKETLKDAFSEPWNFIGTSESTEYRRLLKLHKELKKLLKTSKLNVYEK